MAELKEGAKAPKFKLEDKDGQEFGLGGASIDFTVLYFYPKDNTPGCTLEAQEFSAALKDFKARKTHVIGISGGDRKSKAKFCDKYSLAVALVSDTDFKVSKAYGVYGDKKFMGRSFKGIHRSTFIVNTSGVVVRTFPKVKPEGHAEEVLAALDELRSASGKAKGKTGKPKVKASKKVASKKRTTPKR
jgi:peroxiredoxin Q/BCP